MSRSINSHAYALQGMSEGSALYGADIGGIPHTAKFASLLTKQGGQTGYRTSRTIQKMVTVAGVSYPVSASYTVFHPIALPSSDAASAVSELRSLIGEETFDAAVNSRSLE